LRGVRDQLSPVNFCPKVVREEAPTCEGTKHMSAATGMAALRKTF
jgi:hypothetical protein